MKLILDSHPFTITLKRQISSSLSLRFLSRYHLELRCPYLVPTPVLSRFISSHKNWIIKNYPKIKIKKSIASISSLSILGQKYKISFSLSQRDSLVIFDSPLHINILATSLSSSHLCSLIDKKMRPTAQKLIKQEVARLSHLHSFNVGRISIKNQKSRFGSCSSQGNLNFNWQIILFPLPIFTHIILHELTHLSIKNHSSKFWNQLALYDPNWRSHRLWLKKEGPQHFIV
jgi:predicted metal-dependent hydrolase